MTHEYIKLHCVLYYRIDENIKMTISIERVATKIQHTKLPSTSLADIISFS